MSGSVFIDIAAALAVTALLGEAYGMVRRRFAGSALAPFVLGIMFGIIALAQMYHPIEPFDGLIIDLRNIPIALAGAFLGWRGLVPCLVIAMSARFGIGGVGTSAGLLGMMLAGCAGVLWAHKMAEYERRNFSMLLLLALAMSSHLLAALVLPHDIAVWFLTTAAAPLLALNLITVPLLGALLERENRRIQKENRMAAAMTREPESGLLTGAAFVRDVSNAYAAQPFGTFSGFISVQTHLGVWRSVVDLIGGTPKAALDCHFLSHHLQHAPLAGMCADGSVLIPLSAFEVDNISRIKSELRQSLRYDRSGEAFRGTIDMTLIEADDPAEFIRIAGTAALAAQPDWSARHAATNCAAVRPDAISRVRRSRIFNPDEHDILFAKAEFLIERGRG